MNHVLGLHWVHHSEMMLSQKLADVVCQAAIHLERRESDERHSEQDGGAITWN